MSSNSSFTLLEYNKVKPEAKTTYYLFRTVVGIMLFLTINTPSTKLLLVPSGYVNVFFFGLFLMVTFLKLAFRNFSITVSKDGMFLVIGIVFVFLITIFPEGFALRSPSSCFIGEAVKFIYLIATTILVVITVTQEALAVYLKLQIVWGIMLATLYILGQLHYQESQHYNTLSLPIALSLLSLVAPFLYLGMQKINTWYWFIIILFLLIEISALVMLPSRSPLLGVPIAIMLSSFLNISSRQFIKKFLKMGVRIIILLLLIGLVVYSILDILNITASQLMVDRLMHLFVSFEDEPRLPIIRTAVRYICENPIGYGLGSFPDITGWNYPHNLFLDAAFSGGWLAVIGLTILVLFALWSISKRYRITGQLDIFSILLVVIYLLFTFMNSYSWTEAYFLFAAMASGLYRINHRTR